MNIPQILRAGELKPAEPPPLPELSISMMKNIQAFTSPPREETEKIELVKQKESGVVVIHRDYLDTEEPTQPSVWSMAPLVTVAEVKTGGGIEVRIADHERDSEAQSERGEIEVVDERRVGERRVEIVKEEDAKETQKETKMSSEQRAEVQEDNPSHANQKPPEKTPKAKKGKKRKAVNPKDNIVIVNTHISADDVKPTAQTTETVSLLPTHAEDVYMDVSAQMIDSVNAGRFERAPENQNVFVTYVQ